VDTRKMPTENKLTDAKAKAAKPKDKPYKLFDGKGLALWCAPTGAKTWRVYYRLQGKPKTASLGPYPEVGLAAAREKRDALRATLRDGKDPMVVRKVNRKGVTFREAWGEYWGGRKDLSADYLMNAKNALESHLGPTLGDRNIGTITRDDLLTALKVMDARGLHVYVRKVRMWAGMVFAWAAEIGYCEGNPAALIAPAKAFGHAKKAHFPAVTPPEVGPLLRRIALEGEIQSALACRLLALTWVRTKELRGMRWDELDGSMWRVSAERMKKERGHLVWLPTQALAIIQKMRDRRRGQCVYVFPSQHRDDRPMSENSITELLDRIGYKGRMTGHGWRTVASTWANENGFNRDAIEKQLAHEPEDTVREAYNRAEYMPERKRMLQAYADWLEQVEAGGAEG